MNKKQNARKEIVAEYITNHYAEYDQLPTEREIETGTGIPLASVHRILVSMRDNGELSFDGRRSARTEEIKGTSIIERENAKTEI